MEKEFMNEYEAAEWTGFPVQTLRNNRWLGKGLPYIKFGRTVRYSRQDVLNFLKKHEIQPKGGNTDDN